jgi:hypothetical protein
MVTGLDRFRTHFEGLEHQYALIGGAACAFIFDDVGLDFRATKDFDIVLIVEALDPAFSKQFWAFVEAGGYEIRQRSENEKVLYRFQKPADKSFPAMLELFSRNPEGLILAEDSNLTPLPFDEEVASLSAILLDADYYTFLKSMVRIVGGIPVLDEAAIIPFNARAWLDLSKRSADGGKIDGRDISKHRNDVARLVQLLRQGESYPLPEAAKADMTEFIDRNAADGDFDPKQFKVNLSRDAVIGRLRAAYGV